MELAFSNFSPLKTKYAAFTDTFYKLLSDCVRIDIAVGYITADSLAQLKSAIKSNPQISEANLVIGMHKFEKFTKPEYDMAAALGEYLHKSGKGTVRLVTAFRFHGKLYVFSDRKGASHAIVGSNNLSSIVNYRIRTYESAVVLSERTVAGQVRDFIDELSGKASRSIKECRITEFKERRKLFDQHENVAPVKRETINSVRGQLTDVRFELPLSRDGKVQERSNLNTYFGKGREKNGTIRPRHWYEAELIIPAEIASNENFPHLDSPDRKFNVITDDGWSFGCSISGGTKGGVVGKNFRSQSDLRILGRWIKGRLENKGVLAVGEHVTYETLARYGRDSVTLIKTTEPKLWYLDFGVKD